MDHRQRNHRSPHRDVRQRRRHPRSPATTTASVTTRSPSIGPAQGSIWSLKPNGTTEMLNPRCGSSPGPQQPRPRAGRLRQPLTYFNASESERTEAAVYDPKTGVFTILGPGGVAYTVSGFQTGRHPSPG